MLKHILSQRPRLQRNRLSARSSLKSGGSVHFSLSPRRTECCTIGQDGGSDPVDPFEVNAVCCSWFAHTRLPAIMRGKASENKSSFSTFYISLPFVELEAMEYACALCAFEFIAGRWDKRKMVMG